MKIINFGSNVYFGNVYNNWVCPSSALVGTSCAPKGDSAGAVPGNGCENMNIYYLIEISPSVNISQ